MTTFYFFNCKIRINGTPVPIFFIVSIDSATSHQAMGVSQGLCKKSGSHEKSGSYKKSETLYGINCRGL